MASFITKKQTTLCNFLQSLAFTDKLYLLDLLATNEDHNATITQLTESQFKLDSIFEIAPASLTASFNPDGIDRILMSYIGHTTKGLNALDSMTKLTSLLTVQLAGSR